MRRRGRRRLDGGFEVLSQSSIAPDPREEPLDDPAPRVNSEADLIGVFAQIGLVSGDGTSMLLSSGRRPLANPSWFKWNHGGRHDSTLFKSCR